MFRNDYDFQLLAGQCCEQLSRMQEAVEHYLMALQAKPKKIGGWESLIHCLYAEEAWEEVIRQTNLALKATKGKVIFLYYKAAALFGAERNKEALVQLEEALEQDSRQVKKLLSLRPSVMQLSQVVDLLARFKRKR
jgi:tetratricopeptide (TPR) repeat protein